MGSSKSLHETMRFRPWFKRLQKYSTQSNTALGLPPQKPPKYITAPIFYVNAGTPPAQLVPHIGHLYTAVLCDTYKRYYDFKGFNAMYSVGTDEHGLKIQEAAKLKNKDPKALCDEISKTFKVALNLCRRCLMGLISHILDTYEQPTLTIG